MVVDLSPEDAIIDDEDMLVRETEDGGLEIDMDPAASAAQQKQVNDSENLADDLDPNENARIAQRIIELVDLDREARSEWIKKFKQGLEQCALIGDGPPSSVEGGATVVHPLIAEAAVQFQARAMEEIFPASGPVKCQIIGDKTPQLEQQRDRVEQHMNYQITVEDEQYFWDTDKMLLILALAGSTFKKTYPDEIDGIVTSRYVPAENVIVPYKATSLSNARRITHEFWLDPQEMEELQDEGFYLSQEKLKLQLPTEVAEQTIADDADSATASVDIDEDGQHHIYETAIRWKLPGTDAYEHYLISVSVEDVKCLSIRRNWEEVNGRKRRKTHFTHYKYLPGLGFYGWGLFHLIGQLGKTVTDVLRALLDSAAAANFQGGFATRELKALGSEIRLKAGTYKVVDVAAEDMAKGFYTPPTKEPPQAMVNLLEILLDAGHRFGSTTEAMVGEGDQNTPVGTTIARIEQASKVYSGIHKRLHRAAQDEFKLRADLNAKHLVDQQEFVRDGSNLVIYPEDYDGRIDIIPVSDPNITSTPQRISIAEAQLTLARQDPQRFNVAEAYRRYLMALKVPDIDGILIDESKIPMLDPVSEGVRAMQGDAIRVFPEQDHGAHIAVHMAQLQMMASSPVTAAMAPALQAHIASHMANQYRVQMSMQLGVNLPDPAAIEPGEDSPMPPEVQDAISLAAAQMAMEQQQQQQEQGPDPESALKLAQAEKIRAEIEQMSRPDPKKDAEVEQIKVNTLKARSELPTADENAQKALDAALQQIAQFEQVMAENTRRDQKIEQALMNAMATVDALQQQIADAETRRAEEQKATQIADKQKADVEKVRQQESEKSAKAEAAAKELQSTIKDLSRQIADLEKQVAKQQKELEQAAKEMAKPRPEPAPAPAPASKEPMNLTVGPIVIGEKEMGEAVTKTIEITNANGETFVGTVTNTDKGKSVSLSKASAKPTQGKK